MHNRLTEEELKSLYYFNHESYQCWQEEIRNSSVDFSDLELIQLEDDNQVEVDKSNESFNKDLGRWILAMAVLTVLVLIVVPLEEPHDILVNSRIIEQTSLNYGDVLTLGEYNGLPIEWSVLDIKDGKALIITTNAIDRGFAYNEVEEDITWELCSLRIWLNNSFYNSSFSDNERERIITTIISADDNQWFGTSAGNITTDNVFLLSINEVNRYFSTNESRSCDYQNQDCWWWLRSPGAGQNKAAIVSYDGLINEGGNIVSFGTDGPWTSLGGVRPAMWISLEELQ